MYRIKKLREEKNLTLKELSSETGIAISTLNSYEKGYRVPKIENLQKLANFFNASVSYLQGYGLDREYFLETLTASFLNDDVFRSKLLEKSKLKNKYVKSRLSNIIFEFEYKLDEQISEITVEKETQKFLNENIELCSNYAFLGEITKKDVYSFSDLMEEEIREENENDDLEEMGADSFYIDTRDIYSENEIDYEKIDFDKFDKLVLNNISKSNNSVNKVSLLIELINDYEEILKVKGLVTEETGKIIKDIQVILENVDLNKKDTKDIKEQAFKALGMLEDYKDLTNKDK